MLKSIFSHVLSPFFTTGLQKKGLKRNLILITSSKEWQLLKLIRQSELTNLQELATVSLKCQALYNLFC